MMYPFMTLPDDTEIVHSEAKIVEGKEQVKVYIETPIHLGFKNATCYLDALHKFSHVISENAKDQKCISLLDSFSERYHPEDKLEPQPVDSLMTGIFEEDLKEVFVTLGKAAAKLGDAICLFINDMQCLSLKEIGGLTAALHRCNQLRLPVMLFGAGLPEILELVGEAKSYAERLFRFEDISKSEGTI